MGVINPMMHALLTVREAQEILFGSTNETDYKRTLRMIHAGQIPTLGNKGGYLIPRAQLNRILGKQI